jgi:hypothetical protein
MSICEVANEASISAMTVQRILKNGETSAGFARDSAEKSAKQIEANSPSSSKKARPKRAATPVQAESQTSENRQKLESRDGTEGKVHFEVRDTGIGGGAAGWRPAGADRSECDSR